MAPQTSRWIWPYQSLTAALCYAIQDSESNRAKEFHFSGPILSLKALAGASAALQVVKTGDEPMHAQKNIF